MDIIKIIKEIRFPNTAVDGEQSFYSIEKGCSEIRYISKNGEMASVGWFQVLKGDDIIAEIKESVCDIYYKEFKREISF